MFARTDELRGSPYGWPYDRLSVRHGLQENNSEALPARDIGVQFSSRRHCEDATTIIPEVKFISGNRACEVHRVSDAQVVGTRLEPLTVVATAHNPIHGIGPAPKDRRPRFEHDIVTLISF